ncbi:MAG: hypothetical protein ABOK23_10715 [Candidatus Methanoperedens sp.]|nr:hypothetical protein [Candidatus Methanoperedens sp.]MCZ7394195.1 hypothetical protein [Candidatus Methanoperedens sp.]
MSQDGSAPASWRAAHRCKTRPHPLARAVAGALAIAIARFKRLFNFFWINEFK